MSRYGITYTDITLKDHNEPGGCPLNFDQIVQPGITERTMSVPDKREIPIGSAPAEKGSKWEEVCPEHFRLGGL